MFLTDVNWTSGQLLPTCLAGRYAIVYMFYNETFLHINIKPVELNLIWSTLLVKFSHSCAEIDPLAAVICSRAPRVLELKRSYFAEHALIVRNCVPDTTLKGQFLYLDHFKTIKSNRYDCTVLSIIAIDYTLPLCFFIDN